jgi:hypothetical protein
LCSDAVLAADMSSWSGVSRLYKYYVLVVVISLVFVGGLVCAPKVCPSHLFLVSF